MKKSVAILTKDFVNLFANLTYTDGYQVFVAYTYIHTYIYTPQILIHLQETLKFFLYFLKTSEESNIKKQEITIWSLGKNNLDK